MCFILYNIRYSIKILIGKEYKFFFKDFGVCVKIFKICVFKIKKMFKLI